MALTAHFCRIALVFDALRATVIWAQIAGIASQPSPTGAGSRCSASIGASAGITIVARLTPGFIQARKSAEQILAFAEGVGRERSRLRAWQIRILIARGGDSAAGEEFLPAVSAARALFTSRLRFWASAGIASIWKVADDFAQDNRPTPVLECQERQGACSGGTRWKACQGDLVPMSVGAIDGPPAIYLSDQLESGASRKVT